jgi:glutathione S-transferase
MITLHKFNSAWGLPDISPFCVKVETYLRVMGLDYQGIVTDARKAPEGKCPYIVDDGRTVCDSGSIIRYFEDKSPTPLDAGMAEREQAIASAFRAMLEEHFYFVNLWKRWVDPDGWAVYGPVIREYGEAIGIPKPFAPLVAGMVRRQLTKSLHAQGTGRRPTEAIVAKGVEYMQAISSYLDNKPFFLGDRPHTIDATVYGFAASVIWTPIGGPIQDAALNSDNLVPYCERIRSRFFESDATTTG